jgi:hypothetical protein
MVSSSEDSSHGLISFCLSRLLGRLYWCICCLSYR